MRGFWGEDDDDGDDGDDDDDADDADNIWQRSVLLSAITLFDTNHRY